MNSPGKTVFSTEVIFHWARCVNWHKFRIWASNNLHAVTEGVKDSPKCSAFWVLHKKKSLQTFPFFYRHCDWCCVPRHVGRMICWYWTRTFAKVMLCYSCKMEWLLISDFIMAPLGLKTSKKMDCQQQPYHLATLFSSCYTTWFLHPHVQKWCCPCSIGAHYLPELVGTMWVAAVVTFTLATLTNVWIKLTPDICTITGAQVSKTQGELQNSRCHIGDMKQVPY
jgi:hypothetical protein